MRTCAQDLRYAVRLLAHAPGFTLVAALVLALGIGANSAIFSVVDTALLRPLPFHQSQELAMLKEITPEHHIMRASPLNYQDWHDQNTAFSSMAAVSGGPHTLSTEAGAEQLPGQAVTLDFFKVLGVHPVAGRDFTSEEERTQANVVMISERMWRTRFGADPKLVGGSLMLDGKPFHVAGVVPADFQILWDTDIWTLQTVKRSPEQRKMHYFQVLGRLKPGVTFEQSRTAMALVAAHLAEIAPDTNKRWGIQVEPLRDAVVGSELRATTLVLAGVVGFVLLMACANVANLMLARGAGRAREMAVRVSLGAGTARLVRQLLTESLVLAILGGAGGVALAWLIIRVAPAAIPADTLPVGIKLALDARVAAFAAALSLSTGVLFGLAPAWQVARTSLASALRGAGRGATGRSGLLSTLAMVEIAISVMVVAGAGLFLRTLERLSQVDPGFHAPRVLTMHMVLPFLRYQTPERCLNFFNAAQQEIDHIPGVEEASFGGALPLTGWDIGQGFRVGNGPADASNSGATHYQIVGAKYFETLGIPLQAGRPFSEHDTTTAPQVAIVNQEFVRRYLRGKPVVGTHVNVQAMDPGGPKWVDREIVGVAGQVKVDGLGEPENSVEVYVPITQNPWFLASLAVRTAADPAAIAPAVKAAIAKVDKDLALTQVQTMDQITYESAARPRFRAQLLASFAGLALALSAVGVFGVLAFSVTQRTREFGIRMALGAQIANVLGIVLKRGLRIAAGGVALGLLGAGAMARGMGTLLYGVRPLDPVAFVSAAAILGMVALAASAIPALRASRVDPAIALREE
ncbi:MAG TPA: ABC transporter permease [Bryobacteraceae bacterium]|nr:ABC transporter permease [Bryobacteraceae bacterium]